MSRVWNPPETTLVSENHAVARAILIWVAWTATQGHVTSRPKLLPRTMSGSVVLLGSVLIFVSLYHQGPYEACVLKSEGHAELALPFAGPGKSVPIPHHGHEPDGLGTGELALLPLA